MRFAGYAAIFGRPDRGGDVIRPGAFATSLARGGSVPLLWQHAPARPIGRIDYLKEDKRGLRVIARLSDGAARFLVTRGYAGFAREEDVDLGATLRVGLVAAPKV